MPQPLKARKAERKVWGVTSGGLEEKSEGRPGGEGQYHMDIRRRRVWQMAQPVQKPSGRMVTGLCEKGY